MTRQLMATLGSAIVLVWCSVCGAQTTEAIIISNQEFHLGVAGVPEWKHFEDRTPHGNKLELSFNAEPDLQKKTLWIRHKDVRHPWEIRLNGQRIGKLSAMETHMVEAFDVPADALRSGKNIFSIHALKAQEDILISDIRLEPRSRDYIFSQATLDIAVTSSNDEALPCRITLTDGQGALVPFLCPTNPAWATRTGVIYTRDGKVKLGVPPGNYILYAGRGFEYSVSTQAVTLVAGETRSVAMQIRREVPTEGLIACDTHIHNLTYSGHGDATIEERMLTIAGEGIELAVATDHNHHTDFTEPAERMKVKRFFTSVIGNEVTTKAGHFNAYPIRAGGKIPDFKLTHWPALVKEMRAAGATVVQLNHPQDLHSDFIPLGGLNFNSTSGESRRGFNFVFDAIEVVTSSALQSDPMLLYRNWFALLNHGYRTTALGSSDSHDVSAYIVGQGRSYVVCDDADAANVNVENACRSILEGRVLVSMGLLTRMTVNERFTVGDLAVGSGSQLQVNITVQGPSWIEADTVQLFANGLKIKEAKIRPAAGKIQKADFTWSILKPSHDVYLVAVASGPGVIGPFWSIARPYQARSKELNPRVIGSTNPIWVDADSDGEFSAARVYAVKVLEQHQNDPAKLLRVLRDYDEAVAVQAAALSRHENISRTERFQREVEKAAPHVKRAFGDYSKSLSGNEQ